MICNHLILLMNYHANSLYPCILKEIYFLQAPRHRNKPSQECVRPNRVKSLKVRENIFKIFRGEL
jgi:hypothetical protein